MAAAVEVPVASHMRCAPGSINIPVARFPSPSTAPGTREPAEVAAQFVQGFNKSLQNNDLSAIAALFTEEGYWRDHLTLSWAFRTVQSPPQIREYLQNCANSKDGFRLQKVAIDSSSPVRLPQKVPLDAAGAVSGVHVFLSLTTAIGNGTGLARLVEQNGEWKVFTLYTRLDEIRGHEEAINQHRPVGVTHGSAPGRKNWAEQREASASIEPGSEPAVVVVGAGQAGLTAAARLKMLGVNTLVIDQAERIGDNWRNRYHQLVLHDPVWYDHLPYLPFPSSWPIFTAKDKLAQFLESYATLLELNVWTNTSLVSSTWDEGKKNWSIVVKRKVNGSEEVRTFHPRHIIQATGHSGKKDQPSFKGIDSFRGDKICHSADFSGARENGAGKKAVVVGSCNSGHDIAQDFLEKGYHTTIVQRSSTHVVSSEAVIDLALKGVYSEDAPPIDDADTLIHATPLSVLKAIQVFVVEKQAEMDKPLLDGLTKAGFKVDAGPDKAGLFFKYFQRGGGYYINVGASQLIAEGKILVKQGQEIQEILPHGILFADGTQLEADEIVFATGYQSMKTQTRLIFGDDVADKVGDVWGINADGEMKTIWQDSGHQGFWFHGGNLALCRYYSRLLALQIKGLEEGLYEYGDV